MSEIGKDLDRAASSVMDAADKGYIVLKNNWLTPQTYDWSAALSVLPALIFLVVVFTAVGLFAQWQDQKPEKPSPPKPFEGRRTLPYDAD